MRLLLFAFIVLISSPAFAQGTAVECPETKREIIGDLEVERWCSSRAWGEQWYREGKLHRDDGPAFIWGVAEGRVVVERWHREGK
jgi:hypothetical protein